MQQEILESTFTWGHLAVIISLGVLVVHLISLFMAKRRPAISPEAGVILNKQTEILRAVMADSNTIKEKVYGIHDNVHQVRAIAHDTGITAGRIEKDTKEAHRDLFNKLDRVEGQLRGN